MYGQHGYRRYRQRRSGDASRRGFTLMEVVVATALLAIAMGLLMVPIWSSFQYFRSATARADAQSAARLALDAMARELTEAMYVQLDMYDNSMIAFAPPVRVDPDDVNSEVVTPPRPDWSYAVRYWRALRDPTMNYSRGSHLGSGNPYYLARTVVPDPRNESDPWNRWNEDWASEQNRMRANGKDDWAAIARVVHKDLDWRFGQGQFGPRRETSQPGFPYLAVRQMEATGGLTQAEAARLYRDYVVAMTPNSAEYDVRRLEFNPTVVAGEWMRWAEVNGEPDYSVYRARYPLWRRGARYTGWAALAQDPPIEFPEWARDPILEIYRYRPDEDGRWRYARAAVGVFDADTRTMKVVDEFGFYDPMESNPWSAARRIAFEVDWDRGLLRFDMAPPRGEPYLLEGEAWLGESEAPEGGAKYDGALPMREWQSWRAESAQPLRVFLVPDSVQVWTDLNGSGLPERVLTRVFCTPRENSYEFQLGTRPDLGPSSGYPDYGWARLPKLLGDGRDSKADHKFWIDFRWRNNGVVPPGGSLSEERADLVSAYYRTAAVLDINLTVTRADPSAPPDKQIAQSASMSRRVKLKAPLFRVRHAED